MTPPPVIAPAGASTNEFWSGYVLRPLNAKPDEAGGRQYSTMDSGVVARARRAAAVGRGDGKGNVFRWVAKLRAQPVPALAWDRPYKEADFETLKIEVRARA